MLHTRALGGWGLPDEVEDLDSLLRCGDWVGVGGKSNLCMTSGDGGGWSEPRCRDDNVTLIQPSQCMELMM